MASNIALGRPDASAADIAHAAALAGAAEFIGSLPRDYRTPLGERGARLSAGQRQRIALARAFLQDAPLLLLDEPAAHLDPLTARMIIDTIERLMIGRTVVLITHGPGWSGGADRAGGADRTILLDQGRLVLAAGCFGPVPGSVPGPVPGSGSGPAPGPAGPGPGPKAGPGPGARPLAAAP